MIIIYKFQNKIGAKLRKEHLMSKFSKEKRQKCSAICGGMCLDFFIWGSLIFDENKWF